METFVILGGRRQVGFSGMAPVRRVSKYGEWLDCWHRYSSHAMGECWCWVYTSRAGLGHCSGSARRRSSIGVAQQFYSANASSSWTCNGAGDCNGAAG